MNRYVRFKLITRVTLLLSILMAFAPSLEAAPFQGDGKDYVVYVRGYLWMFARVPATRVTVTNLTTGATVAGTPFTLTNAGDLKRLKLAVGSNVNNNYRVVSDQAITVATGYVDVRAGANPSDAWATYITSNQGSRLGKTFHGWTSSSVRVFCYKGSTSTTPSGRISDITDASRPTSGTSNNDSVALTTANAVINNTSVTIWEFSNFDNDQITVQTATNCSVMVGHNTKARDDWSVTPPSADPTDHGRSYGKRFHLFAHRQMTIVPTQGATKVTINDYSNTGSGSKTQTFTLGAKEFYSSFDLSARVFNGYKHVAGPKPGLFSNDYIEIISDKPVWVYSGPVDNDVAEHSVSAMPLPIGGGKQEAFCFVQNGVASDLQIMSAAPQPVVITTMAGRGNHSQTIPTTAWRPTTGTNSKYWRSASFNRELIRLHSDKPIWVLCGDLDKTSWMSFLTSLPQNRAPVIVVQGGNTQTVQATKSLTFTITGSDPDHDTLTWAFSGTPTGATITGTGLTRTFTWTPTRAQIGPHALTIKLTDNGSPNLTTTVIVNITVTAGPNRPPAFTTTASTTATEDVAYTYTAKAIDPDGDPVTYKLISGPTGAVINASSGVLTWMPGDADGGKTRAFTIQACDNATPPSCVTQTWNVAVTNVNDPPKITSTAVTTAKEASPYTYKPTATDPDPGDSLKWGFKGTPPTGMRINPTTGQVTWTPSGAQGGKSFTVEIEVCDKAGACDTQKWTIFVTDINTAPKITSTPQTTALERRLYSYKAVVTDPDVGDTHRWTLMTKPASASVNAAGIVTWTPAASDVGKSFNFTLRVCDKGGSGLCDTQSWVVRVLRSNSPPVITGKPSNTATENQLYTFAPGVTDPDPLEQHTWKLIRKPAGASIDAATGKVTWTPTPSQSKKTFIFEIEVCDRANVCVRKTWSVKVNDINNPPRITSTPSKTGTEKQKYGYKPVVTDRDPGDTHKWTFVKSPPNATINPTTGEITWTPDTSQGGKDIAFEIKVCDSYKTPACAKQSWSVKVANINDSPKFTSTPPTRAVENKPYTYASKISDPDPNDTHTFTLKNGPTGAKIDPKTGIVTWSPGTSQGGKSFTFEIEVCDKAGACDTQKWTVTVTNVNNPPTITSSPSKKAKEDDTYEYEPKATDPDPGDKLTWKKVQGPSGLTVDPKTGKTKWTPGDSDVTTGTHTIVIEVCDSANACTKQTWTVTVENINDPPKITSTPATSANEGKLYTYNAVASDPDPNDTQTWTLKKGPSSAKIDPKTGQLTWTPTSVDVSAGSRDFEVKVCDKAGACDTQKWTVTVKEANKPPTITSTPPTVVYVNENINYQAKATDPNTKDILTWTLKKGPSGAKIDPKTGLLTWTPSPNDAGDTIEITIEVCDDATPPSCVSQKIKVTVRQKCRVDLDCKGKELCVQQGRYRICAEEGCASKSPKCAAGEFCNDGSCGKDPCPASNCKSICHPVKGCIDTCAGVKCQAGERCEDGKCKPSPCVKTSCQSGEVCDTSDTQKPQCIADPCGAKSCKHGRVCDAGKCIDDPCLDGTMTCPKGQRCFAGQCRNPLACTIDVDCPSDKVCEAGSCVDPGCYKQSPRCANQTDICLSASCKAKPCASVTCKQDEFCREIDGKCIKACTACQTGERCIDGVCTPDACASKTCPSNQTCVKGQCVANRCNERDPCKYGRVCNVERQACTDDPCASIKCPKASQQCIGGECIDTIKPCKVDKDCPNAQLCVNKACVDAKCPPCGQGELCVDGKCVKDACDGVQCPQGQYCWAGNCVDTCASVSCPERCIQGSCAPDPCKGVQCKQNETCDNGVCVSECCAVDSCKQGRICKSCSCRPDPCKAVTCPSSTKCDSSDGQCKGDKPCPNQTDAECPGDLVCIAGFCKPSDCYQNGCTNGKLCSKGKCIDDPCASQNCADGEFCHPSNGQCVPSCPSCPTGERCDKAQGTCEPDPCDGKQCAKDERCDDTGTCVQDKCVTPNNGLCKFQRNCLDEKCSDPLCAGVKCPTGQTCRGGTCYNDQTTAEKIDEKILEPGNEEKISENGTDGGDGNDNGGITNDGGQTDTNTDKGNADTKSGDQASSENPNIVVGGGCGCDAVRRSPFVPMLLLFILFIVPLLRRKKAKKEQ